MSKVFWKTESATKWKLCCIPAATLLNVVKKQEGWNVSCLGDAVLLDPKLTLEEVKQQAENMLERVIRDLLPAIDGCRSRPKGSDTNQPIS